MREIPGGWREVSGERLLNLVALVADPIDRAIIEALRENHRRPLRQYEVTKRVGELTGRRCEDPLVRYHLRRLERLGVVRCETIFPKPPKIKLVYLIKDIQLQVKERRVPDSEPPDNIRKLKQILS